MGAQILDKKNPNKIAIKASKEYLKYILCLCWVPFFFDNCSLLNRKVFYLPKKYRNK